MKKLHVTPDDVSLRLDVFIAKQVPELSRAFIHKLNEQGDITVNKKPGKPGYKLRIGDTVTLDYDLASIGQTPDISIPIIYEDEDCVVIDKPIGLLSHSKGAFNPEATVATWLAQKLSPGFLEDRDPADLNQRTGIVHRLDRATSGVMIGAKTPEALAWLQKQFSTRRVKKTYQAIVGGHLEPAAAMIDMPIERNPKKPQTFRVGTNGKSATTMYKTLSTNDRYSLLSLSPQTGRTHQLRVHLAHLGHPIVGDSFYGGEPADRLYLHASTLELTLPSHAHHSFTSSLPPSFKTFMKRSA